jgi:peptidoglycan/xylan/chitin deacetylase (PgdA/CDA1 family)
MRFFRTPRLVQQFMPGFVWRKPGPEQVVYLTFDDGPIPEVTDFVLAALASHRARATFFCVGDNIRKHPDIARRVTQGGHRLGNHTYNHLKGWQTSPEAYLQNVALCEDALAPFVDAGQQKLFRPPHGRMRRDQFRQLKAQYQVVMWEVLTYDFDARLPATVCLEMAIKHTRPGSIVVFHDSLKAKANLQYVLPRYLAYLDGQGYRFETL